MANMANIDDFYPLNRIMALGKGAWQTTATVNLRNYLGEAKQGNVRSEVRLCNLIGQIRRSSPNSQFISPGLSIVMRQATAWLRSAGRKVELGNRNPGYWITERDGKTPRF